MAKKRRPQTKAAHLSSPTGRSPWSAPVSPARAVPAAGTRRATARAAADAVTELVQRPFEGLPGECDWVALRELVPAATVELTLKDGLPEGVPAVRSARCCRWPGRRCAGRTARCCSACRTTPPPATSAATSPIRCCARWPPSRATRWPPGAPTRTDRGCRTCWTWRPRSRRWCTRGSTSGWTERREGDRRGRRLAGTGERGGDPDRAAVRRGSGVLVRDAGEEPPAVGHAAPGGAAAGRARPAARGRRSVAGRRHPAGRLVPGARAHRAGVGPAAPDDRGRLREARGGVRRSGWPRRSARRSR